MLLRVAAVLLLTLQLNQLALPVLCAPLQRPTAACHDTQTAGTLRLAAPSPAHTLPCANGGMCGVAATGLPETPVALTDPAGRVPAVSPVRQLRPGDPPQPLSPPPQA